MTAGLAVGRRAHRRMGVKPVPAWYSQPMLTPKPLLAAGISLLLVFSGTTLTGCGDDPGEDEIGDGEIIDEGD